MDEKVPRHSGRGRVFIGSSGPADFSPQKRLTRMLILPDGEIAEFEEKIMSRKVEDVESDSNFCAENVCKIDKE